MHWPCALLVRSWSGARGGGGAGPRSRPEMTTYVDNCYFQGQVVILISMVLVSMAVAILMAIEMVLFI